MKIGVVFYPGTNCEHDVHHVLESVMGVDVESVWHREDDLRRFDAVVLSGGFSYGDYLRSGAIAALSPVMREVRRMAEAGAPVLGICNGFQVLCEAGLLPGALQRNQRLRFICEDTPLIVESTDTPFTSHYTQGQEISLPVANFDGNFQASDEVIRELEGEGRIVFRYRDNPNGSAARIAGICNDRRNVVGFMPHPERAAEEILGRTDGRPVFDSLLAHLRRAA